MFSDLRHQPPPPHFAVTHHLATTSEEADSKKVSNATNDDASIDQVVRRPRGRPPGSKNKPKPPVFVTREPDPAMSPYVLEISDGSDIVAAITQFCNNRTTSLCVLSGSGTVLNVSFQQPTTTAAVSFNGRYDLLSISATILPSSVTSTGLEGSEGVTDILARLPAARFAVSLAGPRGLTIGGVVIGPLIAVGTVKIVAASFNEPLYHRLPMEEDDHARSSGGASASVAREQSPGSGGGDSGRHHSEPSPAVDSISMYSCHLPYDVIWAPIPRYRQPPVDPSTTSISSRRLSMDLREY